MSAHRQTTYTCCFMCCGKAPLPSQMNNPEQFNTTMFQKSDISTSERQSLFRLDAVLRFKNRTCLFMHHPCCCSFRDSVVLCVRIGVGMTCNVSCRNPRCSIKTFKKNKSQEQARLKKRSLKSTTCDSSTTQFPSHTKRRREKTMCFLLDL
jgi:hypothetical protein